MSCLKSFCWNVILTNELIKFLVAFILLIHSMQLYDNHVEFFCLEPSPRIQYYLSVIIVFGCLIVLTVYSSFLDLIPSHIYDAVLILFSCCMVFCFKGLIYNSKYTYFCDEIVIEDFLYVLADNGYFITLTIVSLVLRITNEWLDEKEEEEKEDKNNLQQPLLIPDPQQQL